MKYNLIMILSRNKTTKKLSIDLPDEENVYEFVKRFKYRDFDSSNIFLTGEDDGKQYGLFITNNGLIGRIESVEIDSCGIINLCDIMDVVPKLKHLANRRLRRRS